MKIHDLIQGSPEWLAYRAQHFNASDAPAMMGCSPYKSRAELLREMHSGVPAEVDVGTQMRFNNGHRAEALARPLAEEFIGSELYPVTGSEGKLSASFDGITLDESEGFEHKALNRVLRDAFKAMERIAPGAPLPPLAEGRLLPIYHRVQMEQQLLISGATRILFMASEWTADEELVEEQHCWYYPDPELRQQIIDGWAQFERDLVAYAAPEPVDAAPVGRAPEQLPALRIEVTGQVTASNLAEFKATALMAIRSVNRELRTDADFADAEKAVKWCGDVESRLAAAKEHALSQTASIDALFKAIDDISAEARRVRLDLDKLVTRRKVEVKDEAVVKARGELDKRIGRLNAELAPFRILPIAADFGGAIKGKRTLASMQEALDGVLTSSTIAAENAARAIRANLTVFKERATGFEFLFADLGQVVHKAADDFSTLVQSRIDAHKAAEARKEAERQAAEAQRIAQAEQRAREQEAARIAEEQKRQAAIAEAKSIVDAMTPAFQAQRAATAIAPPAVKDSLTTAPQPAPAPRAAEPATLNLGAICGRLGFTVSAAFLADTLHIQPAKTDKTSKLYAESQFGSVCSQLVSHISAMAELYAGETA